MTEWIFQCNPDRYDVHAAVAANLQDWWSTPQYRTQIAVGDRVWLSVVGRHDPGIYYIASVTSPPYEMDDAEFGRWKTDIRFTHRIDPPLLRSALMSHPVLRECRALRGFQGTNQPLAPEYAARLWELAQPALQELSPAPTRTEDIDVGKAIERHTSTVRRQLKDAFRTLSPLEFEQLIVRVLRELEFEVEHLGQTGDGGVDAEAILSMRGLTAVRTKVQAKRWTNTVSARVVRELRGALKIDERGLIITTSDFSPDARREAQAEGKARIGLLSGDELADLCMEREIGVVARTVRLYKIDPGRLLTLDAPGPQTLHDDELITAAEEAPSA